MNFLLILTVCAAIVMVITAHKYLKWQAILWLGVLFATTFGGALLLSNITDIQNMRGVGEQSVTGLPLFVPGPEVSILGEGWGFVFIAFCCGIAFIVAGLIKKRRAPQDEKPLPESKPNLSEVERIVQDLENKIAEVNIDDPIQRGEKDATMVGGPIPQRNATEPEGYELDAREQYEMLGDTFVQQTIEHLKQEIGDAIMKLSNIKDALVSQPYEAIAMSHYGENVKQISDAQMDDMRTQVTVTKQERDAFIKRLKLNPGESPDFPTKRTTLKKLLIYGGIFALVEFLVSYYFLESQIGDDAIKVAGLAVVVILLLAFGSATLFQFMRRGQTIAIRTLASTAYATLLLIVFGGFGLLLNYRDVFAKEGVASKFDAILDSYGSLLTDLTNLTIFLINLFALAFFYWKTLLFFDRFHGYSHVDRPYRAAKEAWDDMFEDNNASIKAALDHASDEADNNSNNADNEFNSAQEKKVALESIKSITKPEIVRHLHKAYRDDIKEYRDSNRQRRNHRVHPIPAYFNQDAEFRAVEDHFADDYGAAKFLEKHSEAIENTSDVRQSIQQAGYDWQAERPQCNDRWTKEFQRKVNAAGQ